MCGQYQLTVNSGMKRLSKFFLGALFLTVVSVSWAAKNIILEVVGEYEGITTWDGGESPVTTAIFQQGDSLILSETSSGVTLIRLRL